MMSPRSQNPNALLPPAGVVLAGGHSRRMGRPKAWLPVDGRPMLEVVAAALRSGLDLAAAPRSAPPLVIVGAAGQELPEVPDAMMVRDDVADEGPLRGMAAGLAALAGRAEAAFVSSCDVPLLRPEFVARLFDLLGDNDIVVPEVDGRHHPLAAVYRLRVLPVIQELLAAGRRRPFFLFEQVRTPTVGAADLPPADPDLRSLRNLNTPGDYDAAVAGRRPGDGRGAPP
jgi:molybdopterin-guanine dinucleotide biosynthesis protein A